jgi:hypothetical protein
MKYRVGFSIALFAIAFLLGYSSKKVTTPHEETPVTQEEAKPEEMWQDISADGTPAVKTDIILTTPNQPTVKNPECLKDPAVKQASLENATLDELHAAIEKKNDKFYSNKVKSRYTWPEKNSEEEKENFKIAFNLRKQSPHWLGRTTISANGETVPVTLILYFYRTSTEVSADQTTCWVTQVFYEFSKMRAQYSQSSCGFDVRDGRKYITVTTTNAPKLAKYVSDLHATIPTEPAIVDYILSVDGEWQNGTTFNWEPISKDDADKISESWVETQ